MTMTQTGSTDIGGYPTPAASVAQLFYDRVAATPTAEAFRFPARDGWTSVSWAGAAEAVKTLAAGLLSLGIQPEQRVAIASNTRIEWLYADLAVMCAGAATTPTRWRISSPNACSASLPKTWACCRAACSSGW